MSSKKRKRRVNRLFHGRFHNAHFFWQPDELLAWLNIAPVGREFGRPDYERLTQEDLHEWRSNLASIVNQCRIHSEDCAASVDRYERKDAVNVQLALREMGHDVNLAVAAAV